MKKAIFNICEYGLIRSEKDYPGSESLPLQEIYLSNKHFDSLYSYISEHQDLYSEAERPFSLTSKGKKRQIKVKNYVGVIETSDGLHLEILPKIHLGKTENQIQETKRLFLKMLRHLKDSPFVNIDTAHLNTPKDFPVLEVFIQSYINEVEEKLQHGIKHDYILHTDNLNHLKGKIKIANNVRFNHSNKAKFYCEYSDYSSNIALNRIIKCTLFKLLKLSNSHQNIYAINKLLAHLEDVSFSKDTHSDFARINTQNKLLLKYKTIVDWSKVFLKNQSFTNFKGDNLNTAILFPMERIFEDYIAYVFKKYSVGYKIKTQDKSYFLVEHRAENRFGLRPDLVLNKEETRQKLIDTKWKLIDELAERRNYNISQADMYQLYAYGKKYSLGQEPRLVLLYPSNENFNSKLDSFIYEGDLQLEVVPFNLNSDEKNQVEYILSL